MSKNLPRSITIAAYAIFASLGVNFISIVITLIRTEYRAGPSILVTFVSILIWVALAFWILQGNKLARIIYTVLFAINLVLFIIGIASIIRYFRFINLLVFISMGLHVFAIVQLYSNTASAYYKLSADGSSRPDSTYSEYEDDF